MLHSIQYGDRCLIGILVACYRPPGCAAELPRRRLQDRELGDRTSLPKLHPRAQGHCRSPNQPTRRSFHAELIVPMYPADPPTL